jgi:hypothetical protein
MKCSADLGGLQGRFDSAGDSDLYVILKLEYVREGTLEPIRPKVRLGFSLDQLYADMPDEALRRGLGRLQAAEFLYETELYPNLEYSFKHALTHEVSYNGLLQERWRALHARVVEAIERLYHDRLGEQIERLAYHAVRGELREKAVPYLRQAGLRAAARSALPDARA